MRSGLIFLSVCISGVLSEWQPLVEISNGWVQGTVDTSYKGRYFSSFEGIPYARPPIRDLRFEPPKEPYNWTGTLIANTKCECLQLMMVPPNEVQVAGREDCLYLNVYVPRENPTSSDNLDVIVHIHGGAFMMGSGHMYAGPKYLMDEDLILVTMNYRLGPFGFLSTEDEVVPGNNGMKDQVESLRWIQKNIKYFGGNPDSITITGLSAGAASVHLHYFSALSKGLFHRGFSDGGNALDPWVLQKRPLEKAQRLASMVGCPNKTSREMVSCLRSRSAVDITEKLKNIWGLTAPIAPFALVVEVANEEAFLSELPIKMLTEKTVTDLPWIDLVAEQEGYMFTLTWGANEEEFLEKFDEIAPGLLEYADATDETDLETVNKKIKEQYFSKSSLFDGIGKLAGDRMFLAGADAATKLQAKANTSPTLFVIFGYKGEIGMGQMMGMSSKKIGPTHGDAAAFYLSFPMSSPSLSGPDEKMKDVFVEWLARYANGQELKISDVKWERVTGDEELEYLYIRGPDRISMEKVKDFGSRTFWQQLPIRENEKLLKTYTKEEL